MKEENESKLIGEKELTPASGIAALFGEFLLFILSVAGMVVGGKLLSDEQFLIGGLLLAFGVIGFIAFFVLFGGFYIIHPKEAIVLTLFGKYHGTIKKEGFYFTNPFCGAIRPETKGFTSSSVETITGAMNGNVAQATNGFSSISKKISLKTMTLNNEKQKVNDILGNPIVIGAIVVWKVVNPTQAVFQVDNYKTFLSTQCDSTIRNVARLYPYDAPEEDSDEKSLRGSSQEIAERMKVELQTRVESAGLEIIEVRITHLAYAEEIAAAMLQRQQAVAIIAARQKIVEGAVSMVQMAIEQLSENEVVVLDEERKAAMVSNLLVVLCGNKDAQPIVNSGSIY